VSFFDLTDSNHLTIAALLVSGALLSFFATQFIVRRGRRHFLDTPNERSAHVVATPRGGGIAFVGVFFIVVTLYGWCVSTGLRADVRWIPMALLPLALVGIVDDLRGLSALLRFIAQMLTACLIVIVLGKPLPTFISEIGVGATALIVFLLTIPIAAAINFYNFMDGLDGLVAGTSLVQLCFLGWWLDVPIAWPLVASLIGFLAWNWPPAKIFMGDTGSTFLGAAPVMLGILSDAPPDRVLAAWTVTAPLLLDAGFTLVRRATRGANLLEGHREHLYQRLHRSGWSHGQVTLSYMGVTALCALCVMTWNGAGAVVAVTLSVVFLGVGELAMRRRGIAS